MAGEGSRFAKAGYPNPKPFIPIDGQPMIRWVMENLRYPGAHYVLIMRQEHADREQQFVAELAARPDVSIHFLDALTEGTACTVAAAEHLIPNDRPMLIANSDQLVSGGIEAMIDDAIERDLGGSIMVFPDEGDPKWSFARLNSENLVVEVAEKKPISKLATVGIYHFGRAGEFFNGVRKMIASDDRVNNEFYTCPVYNYLIADGTRIGTYLIQPTDMWGLGTPADFESALANPMFRETFASGVS
ncbi:MAG: glycosyltransferase family 2 protein [Pseudomonadota bacterium]